ncbi:hypothetical protein GCM10010372_79710 [Streptomyces tauricus]|uniref:hypothetical protein n=1 Tax=Streptomyces tauricus TaxID=68274 RepID=UPI001671CAFF|nr:hypothetical protein [Streptomyces tauricus]GHA68140.1 hypothetical protein GCM10010372_79710 [Streptomyces tauricus]
MSTTDTAPEEPRRLRDDLRERLGRGRGRAPGLGRTRPTAPRGQVPPTDTREARRLLGEAEAAGRRAARDGTLNPYVLGSLHRLPYFGRLRGLRDHARHRVVAHHHGREEQELHSSAALFAATEARTSEARRAREAQQEESRRQQAAVTALDRAATRTVARQDRRDRFLPWAVDRFGAGRPSRADGTHGAHGMDGTDPGAGPYEGRDDGAADWDDDSEKQGAWAASHPAHAPWEGLTETAAMTRWPRRVLTLLLILVELPVYLTLFLAIHDGTPQGRASAYLLTAAVGVAMTIGPFQAGRQWRRRGATASLLVVLPIAAALASLWAVAAWYLGDMRARIVFRDTDTGAMDELARQLNVDLPPAPTLMQELDLDPHTVSVTFIALLLLSGGIAFLLALSEEHPFIAAYRHHGKRLKAAETALARAEGEAAAARHREESLAARRTERGAALAAELTAVDSVFEAAAHAYLDGVQAASHDPAVTEGAMRLSARYPLLHDDPVRR